MPSEKGGGSEGRDKRGTLESDLNETCDECEEEVEQECPGCSSNNTGMGYPSAPPPSLYRGRAFYSQEFEAGSVRSFAEHAAFPSLASSPARASSPRPTVKKRSSDTDPICGSPWSSILFPGYNSITAVGGTDMHRIQPLDLMDYLHGAFPHQPFACAHSAFSRGPPCLMPQCSRLAHLALRLQQEGPEGQEEGGYQLQPADQASGRLPAADSAATDPTAACAARLHPKFAACRASPHRMLSVPKGANPKGAPCCVKALAQAPPRCFPPPLPQGAGAAEYGVEVGGLATPGTSIRWTHEYQFTQQGPRIADIGTQRSQQATQSSARDEPRWPLAVEVSSNPRLCDVCTVDVPGLSYTRESSYYSHCCASGSDPFRGSKNSTGYSAFIARMGHRPGSNRCTVSELQLTYFGRNDSTMASCIWNLFLVFLLYCVVVFYCSKNQTSVHHGRGFINGMNKYKP